MSDPNKIPIHQVYISLGSNINPAINFKRAIDQLHDTVQIEAITKVWETPPVGTSGQNFLNAVVLIHTSLNIEVFRNKVLRRIESKIGRVRTDDPNAPRPIDLDILIFDEQVIDDEIWTQAHIAVPLAEFLPHYLCKETGETLQEIAQRLAITHTLIIRPDVILKFSRSH